MVLIAERSRKWKLNLAIPKSLLNRMVEFHSIQIPPQHKIIQSFASRYFPSLSDCIFPFCSIAFVGTCVDVGRRNARNPGIVIQRRRIICMLRRFMRNCLDRYVIANNTWAIYKAIRRYPPHSPSQFLLPISHTETVCRYPISYQGINLNTELIE